ncbi:MAG: neutral/alkaline non-lysosomal ceramidase N-terminal domain-containing protein [Myxococcota bacterium]
MREPGASRGARASLGIRSGEFRGRADSDRPASPARRAARVPRTLGRWAWLAAPLVLAAMGIQALGAAEARSAELRAGFGVAALPAPADGVLAGYGGLRSRRAEELLDPPQARALVLEEDGSRVAIVTLDLLIARPALREGVLNASGDLRLDGLALVATHTHSGPGGFVPGRLAARVMGGGFQPGMPRELAQSAARALHRAVSDLAPARVRSGEGSLELARNRRSPTGPRETALPLIRLDPIASGRPILLFAYGAHPTVLSPRSRAYSADYVGAARSWLEDRGWRPIFLPGPLGDQEPISELGPPWPRSVAHQRAQLSEIGARLGRAVQQLAAGLGPPVLDAPQRRRLELRETWIRLPPARLRRFCPAWWLSPLVRGSLRGLISRQAPVQALRIEDAWLVLLPAEPSSALAAALREERPRRGPLFVIAHANDWLGYVVSAERYRRGGYEACMSFFGEGFAERLVREAHELVDASP